MRKVTIFKNIIRFLPLAVLYIVIIIIFSSDELSGDEERYIGYAKNLILGFYTDTNNPYLASGPGYPLIITPFVALHVDLIIPKLLNVFFILVGVIYIHKTLVLYAGKKIATFIAYLIGMYPPLFRWMPFLLGESIAFMIICGLIFHLCKLYQDEKINWKQLLLPSFYLGFLVLVKIIFFQVMAASLVLLCSLILIRMDKRLIKLFLVILGGFIIISPYVIHAYSLTGKLFYLGTGGGEILYHRSTPFENEWGDWFSRDAILDTENYVKNRSSSYPDLSSLSNNHREFYLELESLSHIERDSAMKAKAFENMKGHPGKYLINTASNIGRLLFNFPNSYTEQNITVFGYVIPNMFIFVLGVLSLYPAFLARKNIPFEIKVLMIFTLIYACGIVLLGGKGRHFIVMVPVLVVFLVYVYTNILKINIVKPEE